MHFGAIPMTRALRFVLHTVASGLLLFGMAAHAQATLTGTATYRERMALPKTAVFEATLEDVARADAAAEVLGRARIESPATPPIRFAISYDPARITPQGRYAVRARITVDGKLMFVSDAHAPALDPGAKPIELLLRHVSAATEPPRLPLQGSYWKLTHLAHEPAIVFANQPEPHFILNPREKRVTGSGGCNRLTGSYTVDGEKIAFTQTAGTLMACPSGQDQEKKFHDALGAAKRWHISGQTLELLDDRGAVIASFEGRQEHR